MYLVITPAMVAFLTDRKEALQAYEENADIGVPTMLTGVNSGCIMSNCDPRRHFGAKRRYDLARVIEGTEK